jgi:HEAT repeat protein
MSALVLLLLVAPLDELREAYAAAVAKRDWSGVQRACGEIGSLHTKEAAAFLDAELRETSRPEQRRPLFRARAFLKVEGQEAFLQEHITADEPFVRGTALEALAAVAPDASRKRAIALLEVDDDARVRRIAAGLLGTLSGDGAGLALAKAAVDLPPAEQAYVLQLVHRLDASQLRGVEDLARSADARVRLAGVLALSGHAEAFRPVLEAARKDLDRGVALAAAAGLDRIATPGRSSAVRSLLGQVKGFEERHDLFDLVIRMRLEDPVLRAAAERATTGGQAELRPKAAEALGHLAGADAVPILAPLVRKAPAWQLQVGAARGLQATRDAAAIDALIAGLHEARGRIGHEIAQALEALTGQPFGLNARMWEFWWQNHRTGYRVPEETAVLWDDPAPVRDRYHFYGVEIRSEAVAFLLDVSGSMEGEPLETLKKELGEAIRLMPKTARFNLIVFESSARAWSKQLATAKDGARERARQFVDGLRAGGATNLWDALQLGIGDRDVDTLVLLSDGEPTTGAVTDPSRIREWFGEQNRRRMILLHVVALGHSAPYLRTMALESGGVYRQR